MIINIILSLVAGIEVIIPLCYDGTFCRILKLNRIVKINRLDIDIENVKVQTHAKLRIFVNTILLIVPFIASILYKCLKKKPYNEIYAPTDHNKKVFKIQNDSNTLHMFCKPWLLPF